MVHTEKILIVEDESTIRGLLREILSIDFDDIDMAEDGAAAIKKLDNKEYNIVVTDIVMPGIGGMDVLAHAKKLYGDIVVFIMTGQATLDTAMQAVHLGADEYFTKPFNAQALRRAIITHLERQRYARENSELQKQVIRDRDRLKKSYVELSILYNLTKKLSYNFDVSEVFNSVLDSLSEAIGNDFCSVYELNRNRITVKSNVQMNGRLIEWLKASVRTYAEEHLERTLSENEPEIEIDEADSAEEGDFVVNSHINIFLLHRKEPFGVLTVAKCMEDAFTEDDYIFLIKLAEESSTLFSQLQDVIESRRSRVQRILDDIPDGFIMLDLEDDSLIMNPAACAMFCEGGKTLPNRVKMESIVKLNFAELSENASRTTLPFIHEFTVTRGGKESAVYNAHVGILCDDKAHPESVLMALRDVTKERELDRLKSEFISNVSHELRTPAAVIKEFLSILRDNIAGELNERQAEFVQIMHNNIERLLRLIDNLLNINRIESKTLKLRKRWFLLKKVLKSVSDSMNVRYERSKIILVTEFDPSIENVYADPDAVTQILMNCLDNARKFSYEGGEVLFRTEQDSDAVRFYIQDHGRGIAQKDIQGIFERFYRVDNKDDVRVEGSGLGLPIAKEFVKMHKGTIQVKSEPGKGSTFIVTLPAKPDDE